MDATRLRDLSDAELAREVKAKCNNDYAKAYCDPFIDGRIAMHGRDGSRTQWLYVRSNLTHWRGDEAKQYKAEIDRRSKFV